MKEILLICSYREYLTKLLRKKNPKARLEDVEYCVQNSLIKATRHFDQWKGECSLKTWLTVITLRMYAESFRKKYTSQEYVLSSLEDEYIFENIIQDDFSETLCNDYCQKDLLKELLSGFEDNIHIQTFKLNVVDDVDYKDIAIQQNIPIGTVKSRVFRARKLLQEKYRLISDKYLETTV